MFDLKRGLIVLALLGVAGWSALQWLQRSKATHRFGFAVEGPMGCQAELDYGVGDGRHTDVQGLPWEGEPVESHGDPTVVLRARTPGSCALQPEQLHCTVTRDGLPWQRADAHRTTDPTNGTPNGALCEIAREAHQSAE